MDRHCKPPARGKQTKKITLITTTTNNLSSTKSFFIFYYYYIHHGRERRRTCRLRRRGGTFDCGRTALGCNLLLLFEEALFYFFRYAGTMTRL